MSELIAISMVKLKTFDMNVVNRESICINHPMVHNRSCTRLWDKYPNMHEEIGMTGCMLSSSSLISVFFLVHKGPFLSILLFIDVNMHKTVQDALVNTRPYFYYLYISLWCLEITLIFNPQGKPSRCLWCFMLMTLQDLCDFNPQATKLF